MTASYFKLYVKWEEKSLLGQMSFCILLLLLADSLMVDDDEDKITS